MSPDLANRLARLGRWPTRLRRVAAVACLLLAAATALHPNTRAGGVASREQPTPAAVNPLTRQLRPGQVAAPVTLTGSAAGGFLRAGDRVDLYAGGSSIGGTACTQSGTVASAVRVLATPASRPGLADRDAGVAIVVALSAATAARLAQTQGCAMFAVLRR